MEDGKSVKVPVALSVLSCIRSVEGGNSTEDNSCFCSFSVDVWIGWL